MSLHDAYLRRTPYEIAFPDEAALSALEDEVSEESSGTGVDPANPHLFVTMGAVNRFVQGLRDPESPPEAGQPIAALAYQALTYRAAGQYTYSLTVPTSRFLVEGAPDADPVPPSDSGYVQLPQHLFWFEADPALGPESIDGAFWTARSSGALHVLLVGGVRPDRDGVSVVPLPDAPIAEAGQWLEVDARGDGSDFKSTLPGGELDGLYSIQTAGEAFKLLARLFAYLGRWPDAAVSCEPTEGAEGPPPSRLPYTRVDLDA